MKYLCLILCYVLPLWTHGQLSDTFQIRTIAFYNVENLFDTVRDTLIFDEDRTPEGKDRWTLERYKKKVTHIAQVLSEIGSDITKTAPDIIGVCEVENRKVLDDVVQHPYLQNSDYGIVHFDSPDLRGIDVALIYKRAAFIPITFQKHGLLLINIDEEQKHTRDQLVVGGLLDDELLYFIVNHWPSRSGGEIRSKPNRLAAARLNKKIIDSIKKIEPSAKIISMGDFNDDPTDDSFKKILKTKGNSKQLTEKDLFNPMEAMHKKGIGSLAYRDKWNLFDQLFFTSNFINPDRTTYSFWKAGIYNPSYLIDPKGQYKGYPLRTYAGGTYVGGYSDHFPVYLYVIKKRN
ncbi:endonuclease/exonuclease/phosphatase family protein [Arenibacter sp. GZD96]|uniref:endonuclease/exonuclease/phosphatase family protein n=1 Tax=Aurantibrevibacter litoralis TaxID=3106030 RepID=UPI002AFDDE38|nr:endonuclease/exonuclease/phosphatase family protein [Arenibacter sp. GZD-96]MEA1785624.1 endonuclease/exonuclease/phosphatase family protein [Arenibacter sp. GZD-96]